MPTETNYMLGAGKILLAERVSGTLGNYKYVGESPSLSVSASSETKPLFSSDRAVKRKIRNPITQVDYSASFSASNISNANLAKFFLGEISSVSQPLTSVTDESHTVDQGDFIRLGVTTANKTGVRNVSNVVVTNTGDTVTYAIDTDYRLTPENGVIEIVDGGAIAAASAEEILVDYDIAAESREQVLSKGRPFEGAMLYIADNTDGTNKDLSFPSIILSPNGEFSLKGDDWARIPFSCEILELDDQTEAVILDSPSS